MRFLLRITYKIIYLSSISLILLGLTSCFEEDSYVDTKKGNFDALWKIIDERYCFFDYKEIDWNEVYLKYSAQITEDMTHDELFEVLGNMLEELKDGHVNLIATHDRSRYWKWYEDYPDNFYEQIQRKYIGTDYSLAGGLKYKILDNNIGYIYYGDFSSGLGEGNLDQVLYRMRFCDGIVIDVRHNGGGLLSNSEKFASRFFKEKTHIGYILHKSGKGHNEFSKPYKRYISPPANRVKYLKTVVVLTNRRSYSATNDFVNSMRYAPNTTIIGDRTGGGSGLPFTSEIPNGWLVRFSASPILDAEGEHTEFGIEPNIRVDITEADIWAGRDAILERGFEYIQQNKNP